MYKHWVMLARLQLHDLEDAPGFADVSRLYMQDLFPLALLMYFMGAPLEVCATEIIRARQRFFDDCGILGFTEDAVVVQADEVF